MRMRRLATSAAAVLVLAGGSAFAYASSDDHGGETASSGQKTAAAVVAGLARTGLPVAGARRCVKPSPTSPDLPAAVAFRDSRLAQSYPVPTVFAGGDVEVFATKAALRRRVADLRAEENTAGAFGFDEGGHAIHHEWRYVVGTVLLRLSGDLGPQAASAYHAALQRAALRPSGETVPEEVPCSI